MPESLLALAGVAASIAFVHALAGPDHYVPFVAMARAGEWSRRKTLTITLACGVGHVASSLILALLGVLLAIKVDGLLGLESVRGEIASWGLIAFGLVYTAWGVRAARRGHEHSHSHTHSDGTLHRHRHSHRREHLHVHRSHESKRLTPWLLFVLFLLGPCEPLIPLLMLEGMIHSWFGFVVVGGVFAFVTLAVMIAMVSLGFAGSELLRMPRLEAHAHAMGGLTILACGIGVRFLGL